MEYVPKVELLTRMVLRERQTANEWKAVAENRLDMLKTILERVQEHSDAASPILMSLGIDHSTPSGMAFMNSNLVSGEETMLSFDVISSTLFSGVLVALRQADELQSCIDSSSAEALQGSATSRPQTDLGELIYEDSAGSDSGGSSENRSEEDPESIPSELPDEDHSDDGKTGELVIREKHDRLDTM